MNEVIKVFTDLAIFVGAIGVVSYGVVDVLTNKYKLQIQRLTVENDALQDERKKLNRRIKAYERLYDNKD
jgi:cell division protein FtsB